MRWSKLKKLVEERFADSVSARVSINSAAYGNCTCGHCWITLDKKVVANFCTRAYYNNQLYSDTFDIGTNPMYKEQLVVYGEMSRQDAHASMFDYVHSLSHDKALESDDVLIQSLAILDSRLGKRRLSQLDKSTLHPLARTFLSIRESAELKEVPAA